MFEPGEGLKREKSTEDQSQEGQPQIKVMVDLATFLDELISYSAVDVDEADIGGRPNYVLTGGDAGKATKLTIWVDQEFYRVSRILLEVSDQPYAEIDVEYAGRHGDYWLPDEINLHHFNDDSRVTLTFSVYAF